MWGWKERGKGKKKGGQSVGDEWRPSGGVPQWGIQPRPLLTANCLGEGKTGGVFVQAQSVGGQENKENRAEY